MLVVKLVIFSMIFSPLYGWKEYTEHCLNAATNEAVFANFKRNFHYNEVIEDLSYPLGNDYLNFVVSKYPDLIPYFDRFRQNDTIGNPKTQTFGTYGTFSPTTLRYIKVAGDLRARFGDLSNLHILELGGGYGGQCKILADLGGFASYTIIDLYAANLLTRKYLDTFNLKNVELVDQDNLNKLRPSYDLVISNYAFLEFGRKLQEKYCRLLNLSACGYLTGSFPPYQTYISAAELTATMKASGIDLQFEKEEPLSGAGNVIITWDKRDF